MRLGVPTLCRYDLLQQLLDSAEQGTVKPSGYVIVDNGGQARSRLRLPPNTELIEPGRNLGVAASWNLLLEASGGEPIVISNDDVSLGPEAMARLAEGAAQAPLVLSELRWSLFAQAPECTRTVGWYDEGFIPAYYEDIDYDRRCALLGVLPVTVNTDSGHMRGATIQIAREINSNRSEAYYRAKWGGAPGAETFTEPFGGLPPAGWGLRTPTWAPRKLSGRDYIYQRKRA